MLLFPNIFNLASADRSSLHPLPHSHSFSCLSFVVYAATWRTKAEKLYKFQERFLSGQSQPGLLSTGICRSSCPASCTVLSWCHTHHPHTAKGQGTGNPQTPQGVEKGPLQPLTLRNSPFPVLASLHPLTVFRGVYQLCPTDCSRGKDRASPAAQGHLGGAKPA